MKILQKGFNYSQDGPGNRLVYHLQGCNFHCKWCSNADSIPIDNPNAVERSINELYDEIIRSRMMFFDGGGVTFTGGEVCVQSEPLCELLKLLAEQGIHTAVETNCSLPSVHEVAMLVDYLIVDFKHFDDERHKYWIGASNSSVKENIEKLLSLGRQIHVRIPVIHGINDEPEGFAQYFSKLNTENAVFEFLAYHEFGKDKWQGEYQITDGFVTPETIKEFTEVFERFGLKTVTT